MTVDTSLFPVLEQSAQARNLSVKTLIFDELARGRIRLPNSTLYWRSEQNLLLFDSIVRGYPIGCIVLWKRPADATTLRIGQSTFEVTAAADARWVIDGLQRMTALAAAMIEIPNQSPKYLVHFDPHKREFFVPLHGADRRADEVPLTILGDAAKLNKWLRTCDLPEALQDIIDNTHRRIVEYAIPAYEIDTPDELPIRAMLMRISGSGGGSMRANDIFYTLARQSLLRNNAIQLETLVEEVRAYEFGELARGEALKCILAASGLNPTNRPENLANMQIEKLIPSEDARDAIRKAVTFLKEHGHIPHIRLIPYPVVLIILTRFFHVHSQVEDADLVRLSRWVWRGAITGLHQRAEVSRMREALRHIREADTPTSNIDRLLGHLPKEPPIQWELRPFDLRSASSRVELLTLLDQNPRRLPLLPGESDGGIANVHELLDGERLAPEIYRLPSLEDENTRTRGKTVANRILINGPRSGVAPTLEKLGPEQHATLLKSHVVDAEMHEALHKRNADLFLRLRGEALIKLVTAFLTKRGGFGEPMMAPVAAYLE